MDKEICCLFDMDGVILDTETQYDKFWKNIGDKYKIDIDNFEKIIKGTTLDNILKKYFSDLSESEIQQIIRDLQKFESEMDFSEIPGAFAFLDILKNHGIKIGLVTSSNDVKMKEVNKVLHLDRVFDTIVTGSDVKKGKPDPECYLLAAQRLNADPRNCYVFEDSLAGLEAGKAAGMQTIGLATTHPKETLKDKCEKIINDFVNFAMNDFL